MLVWMFECMYVSVLACIHVFYSLYVCVFVCRKFRIMDDDGSKTLSYDEFKKGLIESGVRLDEKVRTPYLILGQI